MRPYVSWLIISNDSKVVIYWTIQIFYKTSANINGVTVLRSYVGINKREPFVSYNQIRAVRHSSPYEIKNQQMLLFQFYSYIDGSLHVSGQQAHPQENSHSCSHNHWFSGCTVRAACSVCCFHFIC
jgi:hypothetical protein